MLLTEGNLLALAHLQIIDHLLPGCTLQFGQLQDLVYKLSSCMILIILRGRVWCGQLQDAAALQAVNGSQQRLP